MFVISQKDKDRFEEKVFKTNHCWLWIGSKHGKGYGHFRYKGKVEKAHRFSYMLYNGHIEEGLCILHSCDFPSCVNPEHLRVGTHLENAHDRDRKGRQVSFHSLKTHCKNGHEFSKQNTMFTKKGTRICKKCKSIWQKKYFSKFKKDY